MKKYPILLIALLLPASAEAVKQCMPCPAGTWSVNGKCEQNCEAGYYCVGGSKIKCTGSQYCPVGSKQPSVCLTVVLNDNRECPAIPEIKKEQFELIADSSPGVGSCRTGVLDSGIYRVVLGGGNGHPGALGYEGLGAKLTYNFKVNQITNYSLCAGERGGLGGSSCYEAGGGAGSYMKLTPAFGSGDSYFVAGGGGGGGMQGRGNGSVGGGGIGSGGAAVKCSYSYGGGVGPYARAIGSGCSATAAPGLNVGSSSGNCDGGAGGGGGGDGGSTYSGRGKDIAINVIDVNGNSSSLSARRYGGRGGGYGTGSGGNGTSSHATNVSDPEVCSSCAKLYRLK
jgi:hypothetical protein